MWKDFIRNIVVIFQTTILRSVGLYVRHSANEKNSHFGNRLYSKEKRRACLFSFEYNLVPKLISNFYALHGQGINVAMIQKNK